MRKNKKKKDPVEKEVKHQSLSVSLNPPD
jgi:hypothetical protein